MPQLYTPQSNTVPGNQYNNLTQALSAINTMAPQQKPSVSPQQAAQASARSMQFNANEQPYLQQVQRQLTSQSGIPQLQNQQADMGKIFQMYLADQGLSQKYANPQLQSGQSPIYGANLQPNANQYTGNPSNVPNPYLASPQDILNAVMPQGQGALNPSANTAQMGEVPNAAGNIMNILQGAITGEQGLVGGQLQQAQGNYESSANMLSAIANAFTNAYQNNLYANTAPSGFQRGSPQDAAYQFNAILDQLGPNASSTDVGNYLKTHAPQLQAQGIDMQALQQFQKQLAGTGVLGTATGKVPLKIPKRNATTGTWTLPNGSALKEPMNLFGKSITTQRGISDMPDIANMYAIAKQESISDQDFADELVNSYGFSRQ